MFTERLFVAEIQDWIPGAFTVEVTTASWKDFLAGCWLIERMAVTVISERSGISAR